MASEDSKPFQCNFPGCEQRFTNNDHLAIHKAKHDLSLKLGGKVDTLLIDQTPTPTRFLRNCEETGLFQELAESNPFDQDFKEAAVLNNGRKSDSDSDDAPRISLANMSIPMAPPPNLVNPQKPVPMATAPPNIGTASAATKLKLLETIQNKQVAQQNQTANNEVLNQALKAVIEQRNSTSDDNDGFLAPQQIPRRRGRKPDDEEPEIKRQRFLERNRAAASRCRARKKEWVDNLDKKAKELEMLNTSLQQEVIALRAEVQQLKSIILAHRDCPLLAAQNKQALGDLQPPTSSAVAVSLLSHLNNFSTLMTSPPSAALLASPIFLSSLPSVSHVTPDIGKSVEIPPEQPNE